MLMNRLVVVDGKDIWHTAVHSNHHHLKILRSIVGYFRYDFLGDKIRNTKNITPKELMTKINKLVEPYEIYNWEKGIDLRKDREGWELMSGFIIMDVKDSEGWGCNDLYISLANCEPDDDYVYKRFKLLIQGIRKER